MKFDMRGSESVISSIEAILRHTYNVIGHHTEDMQRGMIGDLYVPLARLRAFSGL